MQLEGPRNFVGCSIMIGQEPCEISIWITWSYSKFRKSPYCGNHVGGQKNAHQPIFPHNIIENSPTSSAHNSVFIDPKTSNLVERYGVWFYRPHQTLGPIDHNLHNHASDANHQYQKVCTVFSLPISYFADARLICLGSNLPVKSGPLFEEKASL